MCPESGRDRRGPFVENFPLKEREVVPPNQMKESSVLLPLPLQALEREPALEGLERDSDAALD
jgi:hypothetical protein